MIVKSLLAEFEQEAENTRKLLNAIPDSALDYKPSEKNWTTGELASHIAEAYDWYQPTLHENVMDLAANKYDKGDISKASNIVARFEENLKNARQALETVTDDKMLENLKMTTDSGNNVVFEMPRMQVTRSFLFNHLYHHRGELVVYLRATGNNVPGLYGPTADGNM